MLEVRGSKVHRGVFEYDLGASLPWFLEIPLKLGNVRGRFLALACIVLAGLLQMKAGGQGPLVYLGWSLFILGAYLYAMVVLFRAPMTKISLDRPKQEVWIESRGFGPRMGGSVQKLFRFKEAQALRVFSAEREPKTPFGFMELELKGAGGHEVLRFAFLSLEQFQIYPKNFGQLLDLEPQGDFVGEST